MTLWSRDLARSRDKLKPYLHYHSAYGHETWQDYVLSWRAPNNKVSQCPDHMILKSHVTNENHYISTTKVPLATKLGRMVTYFERLLTIKLYYTLVTWSCKVCEKQKSLYIHNQGAYGYKIGRMITYLNVYLPIKPHHPLITWSFKITWRTKTIISPLPQCLWPPNLLGWWYNLTGF